MRRITLVHMIQFFGVPAPRMVYVESFARVNSLSLSGKLLRPFVDRCVQVSKLRISPNLVSFASAELQVRSTMAPTAQGWWAWRLPWVARVTGYSGIREVCSRLRTQNRSCLLLFPVIPGFRGTNVTNKRALTDGGCRRLSGISHNALQLSQFSPLGSNLARRFPDTDQWCRCPIDTARHIQMFRYGRC